MSQTNYKRKNAGQATQEGYTGLFVTNEGALFKVDENGVSSPVFEDEDSISNIIANLGVGLEEDLPSADNVGDIYVTSDTLKVYTVIGVTQWASVNLIKGQLVTNTSTPTAYLYQRSGESLITLAGGVETSRTTTVNESAGEVAIQIPGGGYVDDVYDFTFQAYGSDGIAIFPRFVAKTNTTVTVEIFQDATITLITKK